MQVFGLLNKITEAAKEVRRSQPACVLLILPSAHSTVLIRLLLLSKESKFLNHYNLLTLPVSLAVTPASCL